MYNLKKKKCKLNKKKQLVSNMLLQKRLNLTIEEQRRNIDILDIGSGINGSLRFPFEFFVRKYTDVFTEFRAYTPIYRQVFWGRIHNQKDIILDGMCCVPTISDLMIMVAKWKSFQFIHIGASMKNRIVAAMEDNPAPYAIKEYDEYRLFKRAFVYMKDLSVRTTQCNLDTNDHKQNLGLTINKNTTIQD